MITHKQSLRMLSITCRCILYALVSVVVFGVLRAGGGGGGITVYSLQKLDYTTGYFNKLYLYNKQENNMGNNKRLQERTRHNSNQDVLTERRKDN